MVQVVGRVWIWLWASDLENQGIQSISQPASLTLLWLSPQTINGSCFWKQAQISLKHVPVSWNSRRVYFKRRLCFSLHPFFGASSLYSFQFPCIGSCHSCWVHVVPIITHFNQTPQMNYSLTFPLAICQKQATQGQLPWKDLPTGILASLTLVEL